MSFGADSPRLRFLLCCLFVVSIMSAVALAAADLPFQPGATLLASDGAGNHHFGHAVDIDGDLAVIGAPGWRDQQSSYLGAAYVFARSDGGATWTEVTPLTDSNREGGATLGASVALEGDTLALGAPGRNRYAPEFAEDVGSVVLFQRQGTDWVQGDTLMPDDLVAYNDFGRSLDLDSDTLIVGAPYYSSGRVNEAAYVFELNGTGGTLQGKLQAPGTPERFGAAVAVHGDVALVGAPGPTGGNSVDTLVPGAVYVFSRTGSSWSPAGTLAPEESSDGDNFGCAIAFDGQTAVIAACEAYGLPPDPGHAYVFVRDGNTWTEQAALTPDVEGKGTQIDSVTLYGDRLVLGSALAFTAESGFTDPGAAFVYERSGDEWTLVQTVYAAGGQSMDHFGQSVALSEASLLIGAPYDSVVNVSEQGSVSAFRLTATGDSRVYLPVTIGRPVPPVPPGSTDEILYTIIAARPVIHKIRADGSGKQALTSADENAYSPRWSPDRKHIAYVRLLPSSAAELAIINPDGSGAYAVATPGLDMMASPDWSPDGQTLVFVAYTKYVEWDIYTVGIDGSDLTNLTADISGNADTPTWSPDGSRILFRFDNRSQSDLLLMNPDGSDKTNLSDDEFGEFDPDWSPDGQTILFYRSSFNDKALYTIPLSGGAPALLLENAQAGRWSPDGKEIVFVGTGGGIFRVDAAGQTIKPVDETAEALNPDW